MSCFEIENYITEIIVPEGSKFVSQTIFHLTSAMEKETEATVVSLSRKSTSLRLPGMRDSGDEDVLMVKRLRMISRH